jgi:hypothetical protein
MTAKLRLRIKLFVKFKQSELNCYEVSQGIPDNTELTKRKMCALHNNFGTFARISTL